MPFGEELAGFAPGGLLPGTTGSSGSAAQPAVGIPVGDVELQSARGRFTENFGSPRDRTHARKSSKSDHATPPALATRLYFLAASTAFRSDPSRSFPTRRGSGFH